ncbi:hypothetical protein, partial [Metapseudomonas otitidis]|uniref:hypothetical protein n=1 Tax=Metapseudomonas otitidis TaxID=319939 RepID=UPI001F3E639C
MPDAYEANSSAVEAVHGTEPQIGNSARMLFDWSPSGLDALSSHQKDLPMNPLHRLSVLALALVGTLAATG